MTEYITAGDSWKNTGSTITDLNTVIPAGATALWTGSNWVLTDSPTTISATAPSNPADGQQWVDSSVTPNVLKIYHEFPTQGWLEISTSVKKGTDIGMDDGATRNSFTGAWVAEHDYRKGDIVTNTNGDSWSCDITHTSNANNAPPADGSITVSNSYWKLLAARGAKGNNGQGKVKGISFCRYTTVPNAPLSTDGSFTSPNASSAITTGSSPNIVTVTGNTWSDGIPIGTSQLYMTTRLFTSDGVGQGDWTTPVAISNTGDTGPGSKLRYIFSASTSATAPALPATNITANTTDWSLTGSSTARWMSVQVNVLNATNTAVLTYGDWSTAALIKGEKGDTGQGQVKAISFCRHTSAPNPPSVGDGSFTTPNASGTITTGSSPNIVTVTGNTWSDGIPIGTAQLYMTTRLFTSDGLSQGDWSIPAAISKDGITGKGTKLQFSATNSGENSWHDTPLSTDLYMRSGVTTDGTTYTYSGSVTIKGEKGDSGTSPINAVLSNTYQGIPCDKDGTPLTGAFNTATTTMRVYRGSTEITSGCTFSVTKTSSITLDTSVGYSTSNTQIVTGLSASTGSVTITATETATSLTVSTVFSLAKQLQGPQGNVVNGTDAVLYELTSDSFTSVRSLTNTYSPASITFSSFKTIGNGAKTANSVYWRIYSDSTEIGTTTDAAALSSTTKVVTLSGTPGFITAKIYSANTRLAASLIDIQIVTIVPAGPKGDNSTTKGDTGDSAVRVYRGAATNTQPGQPTGNYSTITSSGTAVDTWYQSPVTVNGTTIKMQWQCDGINTAAGDTTWGTPYLSYLKVDTLQAISTYTGSLTSAADTGERLTINEVIDSVATNEFRCYSGTAPTKVVFSGGDRSVASQIDAIVYADDSSVAAVSGNTNLFGRCYQAYVLRRASYPTAIKKSGLSYQSMFRGSGAYKDSGSTNTTNDISMEIGTSGWFTNAGTGVATEVVKLFAAGYVTLDYEDVNVILGYKTGSTVYGAKISVSTAAVSIQVDLATTTHAVYASGAKSYFSYSTQSVTLCNGTDAISCSGNITTTGNITAFDGSDKRLKHNITKIINPIEKLAKINGYTFTWNDDYYEKQNKDLFKKNDIGVIAQEIKEIIPEAVHEKDDGFLGVDYKKIIPLLIEVNKAQQLRIDELSARLEVLENDIRRS
jgi:hypothetical protein